MQVSLRPRAQDADALFLGRYRLGDVLGHGGMSTVYRGVDVTTGAPVAIKVLAAHLSHDETFRRRLLMEARAVSRLPHPNIVRLIDWGATEDGAVALVMELVEGETLAQRLQ